MFQFFKTTQIHVIHHKRLQYKREYDAGRKKEKVGGRRRKKEQVGESRRKEAEVGRGRRKKE